MSVPCGTFATKYRQDRAVFRTRFQWLLLAFGLIMAFASPLLVDNEYLFSVINRIGIYIIAALGLNILTGLCGQLSLGHMAFAAVGGYSCAILCNNYGIPFWGGLIAGGAVAGLVGVFFGLPSFRMKGFYLILSTLAAQFIIIYVIQHWSLTGSFVGLIVAPPEILGFPLDTYRKYFYAVLIVLVILTIFAKNLQRSRVGRAFVAIRDNDLAAEIMGINVFYYKLLAFFIGCFYAGVAGALWGGCYGAVCPEDFNLMKSIWVVGYIIVGGLGSTLGPFFGTTLIAILSELLATFMIMLGALFPAAIALIAPTRDILFGVIIVLVLIFEPRGLAHRWEMAKSSLRLWPFTY